MVAFLRGFFKKNYLFILFLEIALFLQSYPLIQTVSFLLFTMEITKMPFWIGLHVAHIQGLSLNAESSLSQAVSFFSYGKNYLLIFSLI